MAKGNTLSLLFLFLFYFIMQQMTMVGALKHPISTVFIFGDSTVDVGNNNFMPCIAKANFPPNGIDFPGGVATGRFSNGYNIVDFLCNMVGLKMSPPPFLSLSKEDIHKQIFKGINFASGGSGILDRTGNDFGVFMSMNDQLSYFATLTENLTDIVGPTSAKKILSRSLFLVSTGSNDMFENFNILSSANSTQKHNFITNLGSIYKDQFRTLYKLGARKIGVVSIPPIGCVPSQRSKSASGVCLDDLNDAAQKFFAATKAIMHDLSIESKRLKYSIGNFYAMVSDVYQNPLAFGFKELEIACCGGGAFNGQSPCVPNATLCPNRNEFLFWDLNHPSQAAAKLASQMLYGGLKRYVSPINIKRLVTSDISSGHP